MEFQRHRITSKVIKDLKKRSTIGLLFYPVVSTVTVAIDDFYKKNMFFVKCFLASVIFITLLRFLQVLISQRNDKYIKGKYYTIFWISVCLTGFIWGLGCGGVLMLNSDQNIIFLMSLTCVGFSAGGVVAFLPDFKLSIAFNVFMLFPCIACALYAGGVYNSTIAFMFTLLSGYLILISFRGSKEYWDAYENEFLLRIKSEELKRLSNTDPLTKLYNRRFFDENLKKEWKRASRDENELTLIMCDIDHFKKINDRYGHTAGDKFLEETGELIQKTFKRETDIASRYGGEEFTILLISTSPENAEKKAEELRKKIEDLSVYYRDDILKTTMSFGVAGCIPDHTQPSLLLLEKADEALYKAKESGRNRVERLKCDSIQKL